MSHPIQFGYCLPIFAAPGGRLFRTPNMVRLDPQAVLRSAQLADQLGYDSLWVADHLMLGQDEAILEGWTTLAALAGSTQRARLGIIHQAHFFRHPTVAAKMMATLDQLSGGRFIYFADTGTRGSEHHSYGLHYPAEMAERMPELLEGLEVTLKLWQTSAAHPLTYAGQYIQVNEAVCTPAPVTQPHPPIWFGEPHPLTLAACARLGQGWNSVPVGLAEMRQRLAALRAACQTAGRSFDELEISYEVQILIAPSREAVRAQLRALLSLTPPGVATFDDADFLDFVDGRSDTYPVALSQTGLVGTPAEVAAQLRDYIALGVTHFILWFQDAPQADGMRLFREQVTPQFQAKNQG